MRKSLLVRFLKMIIPNVSDVNVVDDNQCQIDYFAGNERYRFSCSLSDYEKAADPKLFLDGIADKIDSEPVFY